MPNLSAARKDEGIGDREGRERRGRERGGEEGAEWKKEDSDDSFGRE